jgi:dihydroorotate dehydrogenase (NAD+) catalytic subunit
MLDLPFAGPLLNAAGSLGFAPNPRLQPSSRLDGFFTNPISVRRRTPAAGTRFIHAPGGVLLHTGHPNPGLSRAMRTFGEKWRRFEKPLFVHLLGDNPDQFYSMVRRLEEMEAVDGVELGMPPDADASLVQASVQAAIGELPVLVKVDLMKAVELAAIAGEAGASGLTIGPARGALPDPGGEVVRGRIVGASQFPLLAQVLSRMPSGLPIIAGVGLQTPEQVQTCLSLGAAGVQLDTALWRIGPISRALSNKGA